MFKSKTLFIVGAGASAEVDLPLADRLKTSIASKVDIRFEDDGRQVSGDKKIAAALRQYVGNNNTGLNNLDSYFHAGRMIGDAMPQAISIDNYIDAHRKNSMIDLCGKIGIVSAILEAEQASRLKYREERLEKMNFQKLEKTWYTNFFRLATEEVSKEDVWRAFENISFITFNYDRCIEHFLLNALLNYYGFTEEDACAIIENIDIHHPYGAVGCLPWQNGDKKIQFGAQLGIQNLLSIAAQIKTFTERVEEEDTLTLLRQHVQEADTIVFLGFAFHPQNMTLLAPEGPSKARRIFATAKGISVSGRGAVESDIRACLQTKASEVSLMVRGDLTCAELFGEYWRWMPRS